MLEETYKDTLIHAAQNIVQVSTQWPNPNWDGHYNIFLNHPSDKTKYLRVLKLTANNTKFECGIIHRGETPDHLDTVLSDTVNLDITEADIYVIFKDGKYTFKSIKELHEFEHPSRFGKIKKSVSYAWIKIRSFFYSYTSVGPVHVAKLINHFNFEVGTFWLGVVMLFAAIPGCNETIGRLNGCGHPSWISCRTSEATPGNVYNVTIINNAVTNNTENINLTLEILGREIDATKHDLHTVKDKESQALLRQYLHDLYNKRSMAIAMLQM